MEPVVKEEPPMKMSRINEYHYSDANIPLSMYMWPSLQNSSAGMFPSNEFFAQSYPNFPQQPPSSIETPSPSLSPNSGSSTSPPPELPALSESLNNLKVPVSYQIPADFPIFDYSFSKPEISRADLNERFDEVSGRLCLLSGSTKYKVTVGEILRRISNPETLHASLINGMLRKGKAKDNGKRLRSQLQPYNIVVPSGRRKTAPTTGFTAFCEEEAVILARDFTNLLNKEGGAEVIAQRRLKEILSTTSADNMLAELDIVRKWLERLQRIYNLVPENPAEVNALSPEEIAINRFCALTHGFGHNAIKGVLTFLQNINNNIMLMSQVSGNQRHHMPHVNHPAGTNFSFV